MPRDSVAPVIEDPRRDLGASHSHQHRAAADWSTGRLVVPEQPANEGHGQLGPAANHDFEGNKALVDGLTRQCQHPGGRPEGCQLLNLGPSRVRGFRQPGMERRAGTVHALSQPGQERQRSSGRVGVHGILSTRRLDQPEDRDKLRLAAAGTHDRRGFREQPELIGRRRVEQLGPRGSTTRGRTAGPIRPGR